MATETILFQSEPTKSKKKLKKKLKLPLDPAISPEVQSLIVAHEDYLHELEANSKKVSLQVGEVFSTVAYFYERVRNAIDYKGEHLLGRNAIERILRRKIVFINETPQRTTRFLVKELIWARYLKNGEVPVDNIDRVTKSVDKYQRILLALAKTHKKHTKEYTKWHERILELASCEIEEILFPRLGFLDSLGETMLYWFKRYYSWEDERYSEEDRQVQLFIAVQKGLVKSDTPRVKYRLLRYFYPKWGEGQDALSQNEIDAYTEVEKQINHPIQPVLYRYIQKRIAPFLILRDVFDRNDLATRSILMSKELLEKETRIAATERYKDVRKKVNTGILRSVMYIFFTKIILALVVEIPFEVFVIGQVAFFPLYINLLFPPFFMFIVGALVRKPTEKDTQKIVESMQIIVYPEVRNKTHVILNLPRREGLWDEIFLGVYIFTSFMVLGLVALILRSLGFNIVSTFVFFVFMSSVLLFGFRIRFTASELKMTAEREGIMYHLFSILTLPFLNLGIIFSRTISKFNFLILIMDFLFEAPLKNIISLIDEWSSYIKERREEVVEVPQE